MKKDRLDFHQGWKGYFKMVSFWREGYGVVGGYNGRRKLMPHPSQSPGEGLTFLFSRTWPGRIMTVIVAPLCCR